MRGRILFIAALLAPALVAAQSNRGLESDSSNKTIVGERNPQLADGAQALLKGDAERGVELTLRGLRVATGEREHEAALSNLCAGYILLTKYKSALIYCDMLLVRNDKNWRAYNNRAVIYIKTNNYEMADHDLSRAEELRPGAHTLKVARAMYLDAVSPVTPEVEVDDRQRSVADESTPK